MKINNKKFLSFLALSSVFVLMNLNYTEANADTTSSTTSTKNSLSDATSSSTSNRVSANSSSSVSASSSSASNQSNSSLVSASSSTSNQTSASSNTTSSSNNDTSTSSSASNEINNLISDKNNYQTYIIKPVKNYLMRSVNTDTAKIYDTPYNSTTSQIKQNTSSINGKLVQVNQKAYNDKNLYYQISYQGKNLGWINSTHVSYTDDYELPYVYTSQLYPIYAPSGCEGAALKMALSVKGKTLNIPLDKFINKIPRSSDPNKGYKNDPFTKGAGATIYPNALSKFARKYAKGSKDITNTSLKNIIYNVKRGNPVIFEGSWRMIVNSKSDHVLVILGYKSGQFLIADPYMRINSQNKVFWTSTKDFLQIWHTKKRASRAMVVI